MSLFGEGTLDQPEVGPESLGQRLAWGSHLLGYPVSALKEPLKLVADRLPEVIGRTATMAGVRLPAWGRGEGFYLWDSETWYVLTIFTSFRTSMAIATLAISVSLAMLWRSLYRHSG